MPQLYGKPFKDELRAEITKLNRELSRERTERRLAQDRLVCAKAKIRELEAKAETIELRVQEVVRLAAQPVTINISEELRKDKQRKWDEIKRASEAVA